jgi:hypothetical protein
MCVCMSVYMCVCVYIHVYTHTRNKCIDLFSIFQEQLSKNRIIIEKDPKGQASASVTSSTTRSKTKTNIIIKNGK